MLHLLVLIAVVAGSPVDVVATRLDGTTISGNLRTWEDNRLTLATSGGQLVIADADLLSLQFSPANEADSQLPVVELVAGTALPLAEFTTEGSQASIKFRLADADERRELSIPLRHVRVVQFHPFEESVISQWQDIRELSVPGDLLVVFKRGGKSLDYLEGVVGTISAGDVEFEVEGQSVRVAREKVAAIIYYRSNAPSEDEPHCILLGHNGLRIPTSKVRWVGKDLHAVTAEGVELSWPLARVNVADFTAGKVVFLSELDPAEQSWQPLVGLPSAAALAARYGQARFNKSAIGGPLALRQPGVDGAPGGERIQSYSKGVTLRSRGELVYRLPRGYSRFMADVGIDPATSAHGHVMLAIFGDDRPLAEMPIAGDDAPLAIDLEVTNVRRLRIVVDYGQNLDTGDWLNLCNARIVK